MRISKLRSLLYGTARALGDVQAVSKTVATGNPEYVVDRVLRREAGRMCSRFLHWLFK